MFPDGFFAPLGRFAAVDRGAVGSAIDSVDSAEAAAVWRRFVEGVDARDAEEDDVDREPLVDRPAAFVGPLFGVDGDSRAGFSDDTPSRGAGAAVCSEGTDGARPSSF